MNQQPKPHSMKTTTEPVISRATAFVIGFHGCVAMSFLPQLYKPLVVGWCRGISRVPTVGWRNAPAYSREGELGEVLGDWADLALRHAHKNTRSRVVRAAGA